MHDASCIFCKIVARTIPSTIIAENDQVLVIKDIAPKAPIHYLILPKKHVQDVASFAPEDTDTMAALLVMARTLQETLSGSKAFRLICNNGFDAGQRVFHVHFHFLSGRHMSDF